MGWFVLVAALVVLTLLAWRHDRRARRRLFDPGAIRPEEMSSRVWGTMGSGKDVRLRRP